MRCFINVLCYFICCIFVAYSTFMLWLSFIKPLTGFSNVYLFTIFTWDLVNFVLPSFTRNFWFVVTDKVTNRSSSGENNFHIFFFQLLPQNIWYFWNIWKIYFIKFCIFFFLFYFFSLKCCFVHKHLNKSLASHP